MRQLFIWVLVMAFYGCNSGTAQKSDPVKDSVKTTINFLKKEIFLPKNFAKTNLNEIGEMLRQNPDLDLIDQIYYKGALQFQYNEIAPELFTDVNNKTHTIWFIPGEYMVLDKEMVNRYVQMMEQQLIPSLEAQGMILNRLESKFLSYKNTKAIKVKYEQILEGQRRVNTQYIITYKLDTFSMVVSSDTDEDHQEVLKNFSTY